jgi:hypothetical protein
VIDTTVSELERGDTQRLLRELKTLQEQFQPTYENRASYDQLVDDVVARTGEETKP